VIGVHRRLVTVAVGAAALVGAVLLLRSGVQPPPAPAIGPDGARIAAYHDGKLVTPPERPDGRPQQPGRLSTDARRGGALVHWPAAPYGFDVRWGKAGGDLASVRFVATPGTTLSDLDPGRYRVEVRSVDEVGHRSEPSSIEVDVSDEPPEWQRGLPFLEEFTHGGDLDSDRWLISDQARQCLRRDGATGPVVLNGQCFGLLRPSSPLVLSDPDSSGVRGRLVVVADTPPPFSPPDGQSLDDGGASNDLVIAIGQSSFFSPSGLTLRVNSRAAFLSTGVGTSGSGPEEQRLEGDALGGPGALHRWELVFTADEVRVLRDGQQVGSAPFRPDWRQADISIISLAIDVGDFAAGARVALVGLTGPAPDGRPSELIRLINFDPNSGDTEQRIPVGPAPTAEAARLRGVVVGHRTEPDKPDKPNAAPEMTAELAGQRLEVRTTGTSDPENSSYWFDIDVPTDALREAGQLTMRSRDGSGFQVFELELAITHRSGTEVAATETRVQGPAAPRLPRPDLVIRSGERFLQGGDPVPRGILDIEVRPNAAWAQSVSGSLVGWVAVRVELDGRRILDHPTSVDGPAVAGRYRFTLDTTELPKGPLSLVVSLIPDRQGVANTIGHFVVRVDD
jgi:hypothetical protein